MTLEKGYVSLLCVRVLWTDIAGVFVAGRDCLNCLSVKTQFVLLCKWYK